MALNVFTARIITNIRHSGTVRRVSRAVTIMQVHHTGTDGSALKHVLQITHTGMGLHVCRVGLISTSRIGMVLSAFRATILIIAHHTEIYTGALKNVLAIYRSGTEQCVSRATSMIRTNQLGVGTWTNA